MQLIITLACYGAVARKIFKKMDWTWFECCPLNKEVEDNYNSHSTTLPQMYTS